jgi:pimeloyl-ACP methyl ester carboxylesterase
VTSNLQTLQSLEKLDPREEHFHIPGPVEGLRLFLRYLPPPQSACSESKQVLFVHGMSFPSALSIAYRLDGRSWRDELCDAGFHVWGLDFYGFGSSDRYAEMDKAAELNPPLGQADEAARQIEYAARFMCEQLHLLKISLIAHSGGTIATAVFAGRYPELVERLVFFAPIAPREPKSTERQRFPAWRLISLKDQWDRFIEDVPKGEPPVLSEQHFRDWGERYLNTDEDSRTRSPASVRTPTGIVDEITAAWNGRLGYDPGRIHAPVAIIRGEWDSLCTDADAKSLFDALSASPVKRDVKIGRATHLMHLEEGRYALYRETQTFLKGEDKPMSESTLVHETHTTVIPGYDYGSAGVAHSPVSPEELRQIEATMGWSEEDAKVLQRHETIFKNNAEHMVDSWRAVIGAQPHLAKWFFGPDGKPDDEYKARVKKRFVQWVLDACFRPRDRAWLDYQEEIGLRHVPEKKNQTDGAHTPTLVPLRYLIAFGTTVATATRKFFVDAGVQGEELQKLEDAWSKTVQLHITLWSRPYAKEGLW